MTNVTESINALYLFGAGKSIPAEISSGPCYVFRLDTGFIMFDYGTGATMK